MCVRFIASKMRVRAFVCVCVCMCVCLCVCERDREERESACVGDYHPPESMSMIMCLYSAG